MFDVLCDHRAALLRGRSGGGGRWRGERGRGWRV